MNNTKTITIAVMALIITMSIGVISSQKVSALTNVERFQEGISQAYMTALHQFYAPTQAQKDYMKKEAFNILSAGVPEHTEAFRNGYICEMDHIFNMKLPFVSYSSENDENAVITPHYMGISISNH